MSTQRVPFGSLGWRLLVAFLLVAVVPVVLVATAAGLSVNRNTAALIDAQRAQLRDQVAKALAAAYTAGRGSWQPTQLTTVNSIAAAHGMDVVITDATGHQVASMDGNHMGDWHWSDGSTAPTAHATAPATTATPSHDGGTSHAPSPTMSPGSTHQSDQQSASPWSGQHSEPGDSNTWDSHPMGAPAPVVTPAIRLMATSSPLPTAPTATTSASTMTVPVTVGGKQVATATLTLPATADAAIEGARSALLNTIAVAALVAVALAAAAALVVSRRVSRPLVALSAATRSFAAGEPHPERLIRPAPGELGEVGDAFIAMAAALRREDELRRAVTADVAHELRTPVTILKGQTEQLLDGIAEPTTARLVSLHDEVLRLERVTDDLATLSAADAAGLSLQLGRVDLTDLARQAVEAMNAQFADADLATTLEVAEPVLVRGDATRLTQVTTNLLTNAVKFTPAGGAIAVNVHPDRHDAVLTVTDTGPGISAQDLPHIFDRFWRGDTARTRHGTGIGLSVVQSLVTAHGGTVMASTPATGGTRFEVRLPLERPPVT